MARLRIEIDILTKVKHPNIINLKEVMENESTLFIITELFVFFFLYPSFIPYLINNNEFKLNRVTGGELFDKIVELGAYTEKEAALLVHRMVQAIDYLHTMNIVHRDLKPENLLLKNSKDITNVKLADFGLSKIVSPSGAAGGMMQTACGTPGYVAPEVLSADGYDKEVDLWSIGVITYILFVSQYFYYSFIFYFYFLFHYLFYYLKVFCQILTKKKRLCGFPPFYNENLPVLFEQIMQADYDFPPEYWDQISETAKNFISRLLVVDPARRMTTKQALEHPWLSGQAPDNKLPVSKKMAGYVQQYREQSKMNLK